MTRQWTVTSHQAQLLVEGCDHLASGWPRLRSRIPHTTLTPIEQPPQVGPEADRLVFDDQPSLDDLRRLINARLHAAHLRYGVLSLHGVALTGHGRDVLLLGEHGAGKSLSGLAMTTDHGWSVTAGDTCLVRVLPEGLPELIGGTAAYLVDRKAVTRWFPDIPLPPGSSDRLDLAAHRGPVPAGSPSDARLTTAVWVRVDSGTPTASGCRFNDQVALSAIYRASGHLLTKVLDNPAAEPLSLVEDAGLATKRLMLARHLARALGCWWIRGDPHQIGKAVDRLARRGTLR